MEFNAKKTTRDIIKWIRNFFEENEIKVMLNWPKGCWLESKITTRFWIITILLAAMAIITLKIR